MTDIVKDVLISLRDEELAKFGSSLLPDLKEEVLGIEIPKLRRLAKALVVGAFPFDAGSAEEGEMSPLCAEFLNSLPHTYHEENMLQGLVLSYLKQFDRERIEKFLPYVDNWAVADSFCPACIKKSPADYEDVVRDWLKSDRLYTKRIGVNMLMKFFLRSLFRPEHFELVSSADDGQYYVSMSVAWYFCEALVKQYSAALEFVARGDMRKETLMRTAQKARDSRRLTEEQKAEITAVIKHATCSCGK